MSSADEVQGLVAKFSGQRGAPGIGGLLNSGGVLADLTLASQTPRM